MIFIISSPLQESKHLVRLKLSVLFIVPALLCSPSHSQLRTLHSPREEKCLLSSVIFRCQISRLFIVSLRPSMSKERSDSELKCREPWEWKLFEVWHICRKGEILRQVRIWGELSWIYMRCLSASGDGKGGCLYYRGEQGMLSGGRSEGVVNSEEGEFYAIVNRIIRTMTGSTRNQRVQKIPPRYSEEKHWVFDFFEYLLSGLALEPCCKTVSPFRHANDDSNLTFMLEDEARVLKL